MSAALWLCAALLSAVAVFATAALVGSFGITAADEVGYAIAQSLVLEIGGLGVRMERMLSVMPGSH